MYACTDVLFHNAAEKVIDTNFFDYYKFGARNCQEIKLNIDATSMYVDVSFIDVNVPASIKIKFYNSETELISYQDLQLCEFKSNWKKFEIPKDSMSVIICFTTEYRQCDNCVQ